MWERHCVSLQLKRSVGLPAGGYCSVGPHPRPRETCRCTAKQFAAPREPGALPITEPGTSIASLCGELPGILNIDS